MYYIDQYLQEYVICIKHKFFKEHSGPENLKKVQVKKLVKSNKSKKLFCEIAFLPVLNFFPVPKLIFGHF